MREKVKKKIVYLAGLTLPPPGITVTLLEVLIKRPQLWSKSAKLCTLFHVVCFNEICGFILQHDQSPLPGKTKCYARNEHYASKCLL